MLSGIGSPFQLTRPSRGVTMCAAMARNAILSFQLTRPSRGVTKNYQFTHLLEISTHTPLAGRDGIDGTINTVKQYFNSHAPRGA